MSKSESQKARARLYRNKGFRRELADDLGIGPMRRHVASCLDALLEARRLPSPGETNSGAAAVDAALIMIAIATMQTDREAVLSLTERLGAMKSSEAVDIGGPVKDELPISAASDLVSDLRDAFEEYWAAPDGVFLDGLCHMAFITNIGDGPHGDAATFLRISDDRQLSYSSVTPPAAERERFRRTMRGGMSFMPSAFANFANQFRNDLEGTPATVRASRQSAGATITASGSKDGGARSTAADAGNRTVTPNKFVEILLKHVGGDKTAGKVPLLRFGLLGRASVGGVEYHRKGGVDEELQALASQILAISDMAIETSKLHPEGWVVVDAFGRPCCRLGEGKAEFHRGAEIIVFGSEGESTQFAGKVNANSGGDPALQAMSLTTRRFAKEALAHANSYRDVIDAEGLDIHATVDTAPASTKPF